MLKMRIKRLATETERPRHRLAAIVAAAGPTRLRGMAEVERHRGDFSL